MLMAEIPKNLHLWTICFQTNVATIDLLTLQTDVNISHVNLADKGKISLFNERNQ